MNTRNRALSFPETVSSHKSRPTALTILLLVLLCVALSGAAPAAPSQGDGGLAYVRVQGFGGSAVLEPARGSIPLLGLNTSLATQLDPYGKPTVAGRHLSFTKEALDTTTPLFYQALAAGSKLEIEFSFFRETGRGLEHYFTIAVEAARLVSIDSGGEAAGGAPLRENVTITFDRIHFVDEVTGRVSGL
jgi:type VI secretion system Hcp family effector